MKKILMLVFAAVFAVMALPAFSDVTYDVGYADYTTAYDANTDATDNDLDTGAFAVFDVGKTSDPTDTVTVSSVILGTQASLLNILGGFGGDAAGFEPVA